jgi:hypothetical protein
VDHLSTFNRDPAEAAIFERHPVEDLEPAPPSPFLQMADALSAVLVWLAENKTRNVNGLKHQSGIRRYFSAAKANLRMMAFLYTVRPDLVGHSFRAMAQRCGCSHEAIRKHVDEFRERFDFHTSGQWSTESRASLSAAMTEHHRQRTKS